MNITPTSEAEFGAIVTDVRLAELTNTEFEEIHQAFLLYGFLIFPEQFLTTEQNIEFGERFGELEFGGLPIANQKLNSDGTWGHIYRLDSRRMRTNVGNEAWHTDSTYLPVSSKCALLSAVKVPSSGGETELADARAGYAALGSALKARVEQLSAYHSTQYSQANDLGDFTENTPDSIYHGEAYLRPLVKRHPETGKKNLFVGRHAFGIPGLSRDESRALLASLVETIVSAPARVYQHQWQAGDTLLWDNRALLHRAKPYDYNEPRVMTATRVQGDVASELAYYPEDPQAAEGRIALANELEWLKQKNLADH